MKRNFLKNWIDIEDRGICFIRESVDKNHAYAYVVLDLNIDGYLWFYHLIRPDGTNVFKPVGAADSDHAFSKEQAQQIVDSALEEAGWSLLEDKLKILLEK